ncbi:hypothetical protein [Methylobacterium nigriterrae]|uniref:hypothetical protein n=1 Tax=Methylobacterium nigriterrae TaxID=3127512 RepID=UPI003013A257
MDHSVEQPAAEFSVIVGPNGTPQLHVKIRDKAIPIDITPKQAGELGQALLATSVIFAPNTPLPPVGYKVEKLHLPVAGYRAGTVNNHAWPVLDVVLHGGANFVLRFAAENADACGKDLQKVASLAHQNAQSSHPQQT